MAVRVLLCLLYELLLLSSSVGIPCTRASSKFVSVDHFSNHSAVRRHNRMLPGMDETSSLIPDSLVPEEPFILPYHSGPIFCRGSSIPVYLIWYGSFSESQLSTIHQFLLSFGVTQQVPHPSVSSWWAVTAEYRDSKGLGVVGDIRLVSEVSDPGYSKGKYLSSEDIEQIMLSSLNTFPTDPYAFYLILTSSDVSVEGFCVRKCASHHISNAEDPSAGHQLPYVWVGNSASQCAGRCAWPFAQSEFGPTEDALSPPNGDIGIDGMIINIATMLAGTATNPFNTGYYQGDSSLPSEAATACPGEFGQGAFAGYPGQLQTDSDTGSSFNAFGVNSRRFLLPSLWSPSTGLCTTIS